MAGEVLAGCMEVSPHNHMALVEEEGLGDIGRPSDMAAGGIEQGVAVGIVVAGGLVAVVPGLVVEVRTEIEEQAVVVGVVELDIADHKMRSQRPNCLLVVRNEERWEMGCSPGTTEARTRQSFFAPVDMVDVVNPRENR